MKVYSNFMFYFWIIGLEIMSLFIFVELSNGNFMKNRQPSGNKEFLPYKTIQKSDNNTALFLSFYPFSTVEPASSNWTVIWSAPKTYVMPNSWIGSYPYGAKITPRNFLTTFNVNNRTNGQDQLPIPNEAGIYDIRYVQDNNLQAITSTGPIVVSPSDIIIEVEKIDMNLGESINVKWKILKELNQKLFNSEIYLCLNVIGSYEECLWKKTIENKTGVEEIKKIKNAGYFVLRIIVVHKTWKFLPETLCIAVSPIFRISNNQYSFNIESNDIVVASTFRASWKVENTETGDWIGLYSLEESDLFTKPIKALDSNKVNLQKAGEAFFRLPQNCQAGPYVLIYFSNLIPVAVSDIMNIQQPKVKCDDEKKTMSKIKHLVIICTENHSFDSYFGNYCLSEVNSNPTCNYGPQCCEKAPSEVDGSPPQILDDEQNMKFDPNHDSECELCQVNGGNMDGFIKGCYCSNPLNFAIPDKLTLLPLHNYAKEYALADRYFQPSVGSSLQNDMYLARAGFVFKDNTKIPVGSKGSNCWYLVHFLPYEYSLYYDPTITTLLSKCGFNLKSYAEGYKNSTLSFDKNACYPDGYDAGDIPYNYYRGISDEATHITDYLDFMEDIKNRTLPEVSFIKPLGKNTAHPGYGTITNELNFVEQTVESILNSEYAEDTLILYVPDESGGFYDHVRTPKTSPVDNKPYGPRIPFLAMGKFAKKNYISHVEMEHSSIVKFIEWNWLSGETGHLSTRDRYVNNIGDLIDPKAAGINVPSN